MAPAKLRNELAELGFREAVFGRRCLYLTSQLADRAQMIERRLTSLDPSGAGAAGNRRSAMAITMDNLPPMFARRYRRGGLMRFLVAELYTGLTPRPLRELVVNARARQRGLPVVEPLGAMVELFGPCFYWGWFLTRALEGATLWNLLLAGGEAAMRRQALEQARVSIDRLHRGGLYHADLNFHNLFVRTSESSLQVVLLDLDKARLYPGPLTAALRRRNFHRLGRSALKLIKAGAFLTPEEATILGFGQG
ncbi:MAG: lipopolysaccharide kinase InaA family protein [Candidatus Binataceae bacterium]